MTERMCEVCKKSLQVGEAKEFDNRANPDDPYNPLHEIIFLCRECYDQGFALIAGTVRIWPDSPADTDKNAYPLITGSRARFNPFHSMDTWPRSSGDAGRSRGYALRGYYRNKRHYR